MPRRKRKLSRTGIHHVILRGINRQDIFHNDDDMEKMISILNYCAENSKTLIHAYCLMTNHVHILIQTTEEPESKTLSQMMQCVGIRYAIYYNRIYSRIGPLFQDRFRSEAVETDDYYLTVLRYIHQNPVKAGIVKTASAYKWSSYSAYTTGYPRFIYTDLGKSMLCDKYVEYMNFGDFTECLDMENNVKKMSDMDLSSVIEKTFNISPATIAALDYKSRNNVLKKILEFDGITVKQVSRVTGISNNILYRV